MKKNLAKLYDRLTGLERLKLAIEASARGDKAEAERLRQTCPRATYNCGDEAYTKPLEATFALIEAVCHDFDRGMGRLQALDAIQFMISRTVEALSKLKARVKRKSSQEAIETVIETFEGLSEMQVGPFRQGMIAEIKAVHEGLEKFSQDKLDLPSDTLLKAFASPYWEWLEDLKKEIIGVEVNPERLSDFEKRLDDAWNLMME